MTLFEQYIEINQQLKELDAKKKELAEKLLASMKEQQIGSIKSEVGTLTKAQKFVYTYSDEYKQFEKQTKVQIAERKKVEEANQEPSIQEYLVFRSKS